MKFLTLSLFFGIVLNLICPNNTENGRLFCNYKGNCTIDKCICDSELYSGDYCEKKNWECFGENAESESVCNSHGDCNEPDVCSCSLNYKGDDCGEIETKINTQLIITLSVIFIFVFLLLCFIIFVIISLVIMCMKRKKEDEEKIDLVKEFDFRQDNQKYFHKLEMEERKLEEKASPKTNFTDIRNAITDNKFATVQVKVDKKVVKNYKPRRRQSF